MSSLLRHPMSFPKGRSSAGLIGSKVSLSELFVVVICLSVAPFSEIC